jgi:hypothetical protein
MRLQMRRVDHDAFGLWAVARESREDAVEEIIHRGPSKTVNHISIQIDSS